MKRGFTEAKKPKSKKVPSIYEDFLPSSKAKCPGPRRHSDVQPSSLNSKQREVYDLVESNVREGREQLLALIMGVGGTGKSHLIHSIRPLFQKHKKKFRIFSFTGSSAFNIGGSTFHNGMRLPYFLRASQPNTNLKAAKQALKGVTHIIIDEISLVGKFMLGMVSERLKLVFGNDEPFGGVSIVALGDFSQSRPVADQTLYSSNENCEGIEKAGGIAYRSFNRAIFLDEMMRQGPAESEFRQTLLRIRKGELTEVDEMLMASRVANQIPEEQCRAFVEDGTALFAEHAECDKYNNFRLENLKSSIVNIQSRDIRCTGKIQPNELRIAVGAKIILTKNLWTEQGLYNGALGEVTEIGPIDPVKHVPTHIFIKFQAYYGPRFLLRDDIPIVMTESSEFTRTGETFTRIQFPIALAFGVTIHKAQGCTLKRITVGVPTGNSSLLIRNAPSMFYVALSRVRRATDFVLTKEFRRDLVVVRFKSQLDWIEEEDRLKKMESEHNTISNT